MPENVEVYKNVFSFPKLYANDPQVKLIYKRETFDNHPFDYP